MFCKKSKGWKGVFYYQKEWIITRWFIIITLTPESMAQTRQALCKSLPWSEGSGADFAERCLDSQRGQNLSKDTWHVSICAVLDSLQLAGLIFLVWKTNSQITVSPPVWVFLGVDCPWVGSVCKGRGPVLRAQGEELPPDGQCCCHFVPRSQVTLWLSGFPCGHLGREVIERKHF